MNGIFKSMETNIIALGYQNKRFQQRSVNIFNKSSHKSIEWRCTNDRRMMTLC